MKRWSMTWCEVVVPDVATSFIDCPVAASTSRSTAQVDVRRTASVASITTTPAFSLLTLTLFGEGFPSAPFPSCLSSLLSLPSLLEVVPALSPLISRPLLSSLPFPHSPLLIV